MTDHPEQHSDLRVPDGVDFLRSVLDFASRCDARSDERLMTLQASHELGTLLSLLDQVSSCWWGCRGGDHQAEYLVGRCCSFAMGAFTLARSGYYDESLSLTRSLGEIANLAYFFAADADKFREWKGVDEKKRRDKFSPVKVRRALEGKERRVPIDQSRYRQLSEKATHITPRIPPEMYNVGGYPKTGGYFQEVGLLLCIGELGFALSIVGHCSVPLCDLQGDQAARVHRAAESLGRALSDVRERVNVLMPKTYRLNSLT